MPNNWRQAYTELTDFIAEHSEVKIGASVIRIPASVRPGFYRLFNMVRSVFIEGKFPALLSEARALSESYTKAEEEVTKLPGLDEVSMAARLHKFLYDPIYELTGGLFNPLFDLLKMKIGIEIFEETASQKIEASFEHLYRSGYEKWVALSLVNLLEADKSFRVVPPAYSEFRIPPAEEAAPPPEESKRLCFSFEYEPSTAFIIPDLIVHSPRANRYIALRSELDRAVSTATNASEKREWLPVDSIVDLDPSITLVYVADNPEKISLVADVKRICRPDLIIECREQKDWYEKQGLALVRLHHDSLKPTLGTYIVSREPVPEQAFQELTSEQGPKKQGDGIHILTVGFDQSRLAPIIDALMQTENKD